MRQGSALKRDSLALANTGLMLALPYRAHRPGVLGEHQWWTGTGHHHTHKAHRPQWETGQPLRQTASTALMSSGFEVRLGYIVRLKPHSQKNENNGEDCISARQGRVSGRVPQAFSLMALDQPYPK